MTWKISNIKVNYNYCVKIYVFTYNYIMYLYFLLLLFEYFSLWLFNKNNACERKRISKKHSFINSEERWFSEQPINGTSNYPNSQFLLNNFLIDFLIIRIAYFSFFLFSTLNFQFIYSFWSLESDKKWKEN